MKKILLSLLIAVLGTVTAFGQFWTEDFNTLTWGDFQDGDTLVPGSSGDWGIQEGYTNGTIGTSHLWVMGDETDPYDNLFAGGSGQEVKFDGHSAPQPVVFDRTARFISPKINTVGKTDLSISFKHAIDRYDDSYPNVFTVGLATSSDGAKTWSTIWSKEIMQYDGFEPKSETFLISNSDVGSADFQICFFMDGIPYPIKHWAFDDIKIFELPNTDIIVQEIENKTQHVKGENFVPAVKITNGGILASVTFDTQYKLTEYGGTVVYNETKSVTLNKGDVSTITFPTYAFTETGKVYAAEVTATVTGDANTADNYSIKDMNTWSQERHKVLVESSTYLT